MDFYVYTHIRLDTGTIFYVGKGRHNRALRKERNPHWKNIVGKVGYKIEFVEKNMTEEAAFNLEKELILNFKKLGQCETNYSSGGEGCSGYVWTQDQKRRLSEVQKSKSETILLGHKKQAQKLKGRKKETHNGLKIISNKNSGANNGRAVYNVLTPDGVFETIKAASVHHKISTAAAHKRIKSLKWSKTLK